MATYRGTIKDGKQIDSNRDNWDEVGLDLFKGSLNVSLTELVNTKDWDYEFVFWNKFRVKKGKIKINKEVLDVYVGYKFSVNETSLLFIFANVKLRDKYNLSNGETVEVIL